MLLLLHIENIAIIEEADIEFGIGFNVLSGETGAGKSIIIDSIGAIMGNRTSRELIRTGAKKGLVSAIFSNISDPLKALLIELGIYNDEDTLHISRELSTDGKNICRVNMKPVTVNVLKQISPYLIDVLGQHDSYNLMNEANHITYLDNYTDNKKILNEYKEIYQELKILRRKIRLNEEKSQELASEAENIKTSIDEIAAANLQIGEEEKLLANKAIIDNSSSLLENLVNAQNLIYGSDDIPGALTSITLAANTLENISNISEDTKKIYETCNDIKYLTSDLSDEIIRIKSNIDFSPEARDNIEERLDIIYKLKRKYADSIGGILAFYDSLLEKLNKIDNIDIEKDKLIYAQLLEKCKKIADKISKFRDKAAKDISENITIQLQELNMSGAQFIVNIERQNALSALGYDKVSFLIKTNAGDNFKPLSKIASGGELSRIMLAIKNIVSEKDITLIFDEIDTGVSGRAGSKIAEKLVDVSLNKQVICVTHLASIASMADINFNISKFTQSGKTYTKVKQLNNDEKIEEISRIISGDNITDTSRENAKELIQIGLDYRRK